MPSTEAPGAGAAAAAAADGVDEFPATADFGELLLQHMEYHEKVWDDLEGDDGLAVVVSVLTHPNDLRVCVCVCVCVQGECLARCTVPLSSAIA